MSTSRTVILVRPDYDVTTRYLHRWSEHVIGEARQKGFDVIDVEGAKVTRDRVFGTLAKKDDGPMLVVLNGHGDEEQIAGHDNDIVLRATDAPVLRNKITYARACRSAGGLGRAVGQQKGSAYIGYDVDFIFFNERDHEHRPLMDRTAALFLEPSNHVPLAILKGHTAGEANERSKEHFRKNIRQIILDGTTADRAYVVPYLFHDMRHQVCLGDSNVRL